MAPMSVPMTRSTVLKHVEIFSPHYALLVATMRSHDGVGGSEYIQVGLSFIERGRCKLDMSRGRHVHSGDVVISVKVIPDGGVQDSLADDTASSISAGKEGSEVVKVIMPIRISRKCRYRGWRRLRMESLDRNIEEAPINAFQVWDHERHIWSLVILRRPNTADWMSGIPDNTPLGELCMSGTHESCALYGYPVSQCQQPATSIAVQLLDGVRFLDVRLRVVNGELLMYHGPRPQRSSLPILLDVLHSFLTSHPTETFILCLKEEIPPNHPDFARLVYEAFSPHSRFWVLEARIPKLGEVRGRGILMTRFEATEGTWLHGLGIHPSTWPDSRREGFSWDCSGTTVRTQDWYNISTFLEIPEKFQVVRFYPISLRETGCAIEGKITDHLQSTLEPTPGSPFSLSYTSASGFPLSLPTIMAKGFGWPGWGLGVYGVNQKMLHWLLVQISQGRRVRACLPMDFYRQCGDDRGLAEILVSMNFL